MTEAYVRRYKSREHFGTIATGSFKISEHGKNQPVSTVFSTDQKISETSVTVTQGGVVYEHGPNVTDDLLVRYKDSEVAVPPGQNVLLSVRNEFIEITHLPAQVTKLD